MSLSVSDLQEIRVIVQSVFEPLSGEIQALINDIKETCNMIADLQSGSIVNKDFQKRSLEEKLLTLNIELLAAAKQAGITSPR